jgi:hypothetical protein
VIKTLIIALAALVLVFWIGLAYWVNKDARRRTRNLFGVFLATLLGLVPYIGPLVYLLFRPAETRAEVRSREAELAALEAQAHGGGRPTCPECSAPVEASYLVCPVCTTRLRVPCKQCDAPLEPLWQICPYCVTKIETDVDLDVALTREVRTPVPALDLVAEPARSSVEA